jgi:hypothetical protein
VEEGVEQRLRPRREEWRKEWSSGCDHVEREWRREWSSGCDHVEREWRREWSSGCEPVAASQRARARSAWARARVSVPTDDVAVMMMTTMAEGGAARGGAVKARRS